VCVLTHINIKKNNLHSCVTDNEMEIILKSHSKTKQNYPVPWDSVIRGCEGDRKPGRKWDWKRRRSRRPSKVVKVSFIRLRCLVLKHTLWGIGKGQGGILQRTKKWASAYMRAEVRRQAASTLHLISGT
jgi:hypothetical protein